MTPAPNFGFGIQIIRLKLTNNFTAKFDSFCVNGHRCSTLHVSCESDDYETGEDYVGLIFFHKNGYTDIYYAGKHMKIGYIVIAKSSKLKVYNCDEGQVHGACFQVSDLKF